MLSLRNMAIKSMRVQRDRASHFSKVLAEYMLETAITNGMGMADAARHIGMEPDDFRTMMSRYVGKHRIAEARAALSKEG
jgi:hypothetical protein